MKRPRDDAVRQLEGKVLELVGGVTGKESAELSTAIGPGPVTPTLLELGVTSTTAASLRSRIFKELEAELSTHQLMTTPFDELLMLIAAAQKQEVGVSIPAFSAGAESGQRSQHQQEPNLNKSPSC